MSHPIVRRNRKRKTCDRCGVSYLVGSTYLCEACTAYLIECDVCQFWQDSSKFEPLATTCKACADWVSVEHPAINPLFWLGILDDSIEDIYTDNMMRDLLKRIRSNPYAETD